MSLSPLTPTFAIAPAMPSDALMPLSPNPLPGQLKSFTPDASHRNLYSRPTTKLTFGDMVATELLMKSFTGHGSQLPREPIYDAPSWIENNFQVCY